MQRQPIGMAWHGWIHGQCEQRCRFQGAIAYTTDSPAVLEHQDVVGADEGHRARAEQAGHVLFDLYSQVLDDVRAVGDAGDKDVTLTLKLGL